jgi:hypothetical protein
METMNSLPQPFVTIYIGPTPELAAQDKADRPLLKDKEDNNMGTVETQVASLTIIEPKLPKFLIHKNLICYYSPFFATAFNGNFAEGTTQSMTLDIDKDAFGVLVNWFYSQVVVSKFVTLARVWIIAEQFMMPVLQNQVMDAFHNSVRACAPSRTVLVSFGEFAKVAHNHGDGDNELVEIVVWVLRWCDEVQFNHYVGRLSQEIFAKVAKQLKKVKNPDVGKLIALESSNFYVATGEESE